MTAFDESDLVPVKYYAAIDLGSNSCRLLITKAIDQALVHVESYSRIIRLSGGMVHHGYINQDAIERTLVTLKKSVSRLKKYPKIKLRCVTTEVCRKAKNAKEFIQRIKQETGFEFTIISEKEEAFLTAKAVTDLIKPAIPYTLVIDVGGGSTEIIFLEMKNNKLVVLEWMSLPIGVINLAESENLECAQTYFKITEMIRLKLEEFGNSFNLPALIERQQVQLIGSSGTATTAAALHLDLKFYNREKVNGLILTFNQVENVIKSLQMMSFEERSMHPCIGPERSDLVLGGMAIFEGLSCAWPIGSICVADRGIRDGIVQDLYENDQ